MLVHHRGLAYTARPRQLYVLNDTQCAMQAVVEEDRVSLAIIPSIVDKIFRPTLPFPSRDSPIPFIPMELICDILERAFLGLLHEQLFTEAAQLATRVHPFFLERLYHRFVHPHRAMNIVIAASRLGKNIGLIKMLWESYFCTTEPPVPYLMKMSLFSRQGRGRCRLLRRAASFCKLPPPPPYVFVDADDCVKARSDVVHWLEDAPGSYDIPVYTRIGPTLPSGFYGDVAVCTHIRRQGFFVEAVCINPILCFDLWLWSRQANAYIRLDYTTMDLYADPCWHRFLNLCSAALSEGFGCICLPGPGGDSDGEEEDRVRVSQNYPRVVDLRAGG